MTQGAVFLLTVILVELLTGVAMGLVGQLVFAGIEMGGQLIAVQAALSFANIVRLHLGDSEYGSSVTSTQPWPSSFFLPLAATICTWKALVYSFQIIPISGAALDLDPTPPSFISSTWPPICSLPVCSFRHPF